MLSYIRESLRSLGLECPAGFPKPSSSSEDAELEYCPSSSVSTHALSSVATDLFAALENASASSCFSSEIQETSESSLVLDPQLGEACSVIVALCEEQEGTELSEETRGAILRRLVRFVHRIRAHPAWVESGICSVPPDTISYCLGCGSAVRSKCLDCMLGSSFAESISDLQKSQKEMLAQLSDIEEGSQSPSKIDYAELLETLKEQTVAEVAIQLSKSSSSSSSGDSNEIAELIKGMTERLSQLESTVAQVEAEKEELKARLSSFESEGMNGIIEARERDRLCAKRTRNEEQMIRKEIAKREAEKRLMERRQEVKKRRREELERQEREEEKRLQEREEEEKRRQEEGEEKRRQAKKRSQMTNERVTEEELFLRSEQDRHYKARAELESCNHEQENILQGDESVSSVSVTVDSSVSSTQSSTSDDRGEDEELTETSMKEAVASSTVEDRDDSADECDRRTIVVSSEVKEESEATVATGLDLMEESTKCEDLEEIAVASLVERVIGETEATGLGSSLLQEEEEAVTSIICSTSTEPAAESMPLEPSPFAPSLSAKKKPSGPAFSKLKIDRCAVVSTTSEKLGPGAYDIYKSSFNPRGARISNVPVERCKVRSTTSSVLGPGCYNTYKSSFDVAAQKCSRGGGFGSSLSRFGRPKKSIVPKRMQSRPTRDRRRRRRRSRR